MSLDDNFINICTVNKDFELDSDLKSVDSDSYSNWVDGTTSLAISSGSQGAAHDNLILHLFVTPTIR